MSASEVPLYDVTEGLRVLGRYRDSVGRDPAARETVRIADKLALHMRRHFPDPSDAATAGHALVIAAASLAAIPEDIPRAVWSNIAGPAGQRLAGGMPS